MYDFHARNYMPDLGRTTTYDPLAEKFYDFSPQSFFNNNPVYFVDPTGMSTAQNEWTPKVNDDGTTSYIAEKGDSAESFASQYGLGRAEAEIITGSSGNAEIAEGTEISGEMVNNVTGSEVLKLDLSSPEGKDSQRRFDHFLFARDHSRSKKQINFLSTQYFSNTKYKNVLHGRAKMTAEGKTFDVVYDIPVYRPATFDGSSTSTSLSNKPITGRNTTGQSFPNNQYNIWLPMFHPNTGVKNEAYQLYMHRDNSDIVYDRLSKEFPKHNYIARPLFKP